MSVAVAPDARALRAEPARADNPRVCLVLGGARSGKSAFAERAVADTGLEKVYLATAGAGDGEMADARPAPPGTARAGLDHDRGAAGAGRDPAGRGARRPRRPRRLPHALARQPHGRRARRRGRGRRARRRARAGDGPVVLVSNEVGQGIVPDNPLARRFRDAAGTLHQRVAAAAGRVVFVTAGLARTLKDAR